MAAARLDMRQVKRVFYLHFVERKAQGVIAAALGLGKTTVGDYLRRLNKTELTSWFQIQSLSDDELERRLGFTGLAALAKNRIMPDWAYVHREMSKRHVTLMLLWSEYQHTHGNDSYGYTQYAEHYNRWAAKLNVVMRQTHKAGEKTFIDYSGDGLKLVDPKTGELTKVEFLSQFLERAPTRMQRQRSRRRVRIGSHHMFACRLTSVV